MMLSEWKGVLRTFALAAGGGAVLSIALSLRLMFGHTASPTLEITVISLFFLAFLCWLPAVLLMTEYKRAARDADDGFQMTPGLRGHEISGMTQYCPGPLKAASLAAIVFSAVQGFMIGDVSVTLGQEIDATNLRGLLSGVTVFLGLAFPVLTSAALMKGGYGE